MELLVVIACIFAALVVIGIVIGMYVLVAVMAKNRHREVVVWLLLSFLASPLLIIIILLCIGDDESWRGSTRRNIETN